MAVGLDLGNLLVHLRADSSKFTSALGFATSSMRSFANTVTRYGKYAAIALTGYMTVSVKAFATFEEQVANVSTMLDDQTMNYIPSYTKTLKNMAVEFGEGTDTLSKGLYDILSASIPASKAIKVLGVSAKAAKAGLTTTAVAADAITTILNAYALEAEEATRISDILFATVKRGKLTFSELAGNIGKVAAIAATAELSIEEVSAALATMTRAGIQADLATTSLRAIMNTFLKPTDDAKAAAREFGFELGSVSLKTLGLTGVMKKLQGATAEQLAVLMPNVRGLSGFAAQLKQATGMASDLELMLNSTGLTQIAFNKMTNTLAHSFRQFWQAIKMVSVEIGTALKKDIETLTKLFIDNRMEITKWAMDVVAHVIYFKDILAEWVSYMKNDWRGGLKLALDAGIILFRAFGDSVYAIMKNTFERINVSIGPWVKQSIDEWLVYQKAALKTTLSMMNDWQRHSTEEIKKASAAAGQAALEEFRKGIIQDIDYPIPEIGNLGEALLGIKAETTRKLEDLLIISTKRLRTELRELIALRRKIADEMQIATGEELEALFHELNTATEKYEVAKENLLKASRFGHESMQKLNQRLEENKDLLIAVGQETDKAATAFGKFAIMQEKWLEDFGDIPGMPAATLPGDGSVEEFTVDSLNAYRSMYNEMGKMSKASHRAMVASLKSQANEYKRLGAEKEHIDIWYAAQKLKLDIELGKSQESIVGGLKAAGSQMQEDMVTIGEVAYETALTIQEGFGNAYADMALEGAKFKDTMKALLKDILQYMIKVGTMRMFAGMFGGFFSLGEMGGGATEPEGAQHGGYVAETGWAKVHKGETYSGVNNEYGRQPPNVIINNNTGQAMKQEKMPKFDGKNWIVSVVVDNIQRKGAIPQALGA